MRAIFISYRREDAEGHAGRLFNDLVETFGADAVFMDVAAIEPGRDFRRSIDEHIASCGVLLAVIGRTWLTASDATGRRRLDDPLDFVRLETMSALKRDIPVIPVLVQGAVMPQADQLPGDVVDLAYRNAVELTHARWDSDVRLLINALRPHVDRQRAASTTTSIPSSAAPAEGARQPHEGPGGSDPGSLSSRSSRTSTVLALTLLAVAAVAIIVWRSSGGTTPLAPARLDSPTVTDAPTAAARAAETPQDLIDVPAAAPTEAEQQRDRWHSYDFPPPNAGFLLFTVTPQGDPACASYDRTACLWGVTYEQLEFARLTPLACGEMHRQQWGSTGYEDPKHWCSLAKVVLQARQGRP